MNNEQALVAVQPEEDGQLLELQFVDGPAEPEEETTGEAHPNFIESNTQAITIEELATKCIVPTFGDNSLTISHQNAIAAVYKAAEDVFGELTPPECRVSHAINGRVASALHKPAKDLTDEEKTIFYQRLAFVAHVKSFTHTIAGHSVALTIGMCRAYNEDRLHSPRKSPAKLKVFCGVSVRVCCNLCVTCNGNSGTVECLTEADVYQKAYQLFRRFDPEKEDTLRLIENLNNTRVSESQFCYIIGRLRLYQALPTEVRKTLPMIDIGDQAVNAAVRGFVSNPNFGLKEGEGSITTFSMLQLFNEAIKQAQIDKWLDRNQNCTDFLLGIQRALLGTDTEGYDWFLQ
jgi:hypothetical protein